ncbi:MAG: hypothetical protein V7L04_31710 [Nostoc sp.]
MTISAYRGRIMLPKPKKNWTPQHWASWKPFGIGEQYPNNYWEV